MEGRPSCCAHKLTGHKNHTKTQRSGCQSARVRIFLGPERRLESSYRCKVLSDSPGKGKENIKVYSQPQKIRKDSSILLLNSAQDLSFSGCSVLYACSHESMRMWCARVCVRVVCMCVPMRVCACLWCVRMCMCVSTCVWYVHVYVCVYELCMYSCTSGLFFHAGSNAYQ